MGRFFTESVFSRFAHVKRWCLFYVTNSAPHKIFLTKETGESSGRLTEGFRNDFREESEFNFIEINVRNK